MSSHNQSPGVDQSLVTNIRKQKQMQHNNSVKQLSEGILLELRKKSGEKTPRTRRRTLAVDKKSITSENDQTESEEDIIQNISKEIDALQNEIKVARDKCLKIMESQQQFKVLIDSLSNQRKLVLDMKENLRDITIRDVGSRSDVEECSEFMGELYLKCFDQFNEQIRSTEGFYETIKKYIDSCSNFTRARNDFDKLISSYVTVDMKLQKMNKEKRPDINKVGQLQQQKEETFNSIKNEGEKVTDFYVDLYNEFLTIMLHTSVDLSDKVSKGLTSTKRMFKDKGEKLNLWKTLNIGEAVKNTDVEYPQWMDDDPLFINIFEAENHLVEKMEYCVVKYAKSLLCNPTLATTGMSMADVNLIFTEIESIHSLHHSIFTELKNSNIDSFIDAFAKRASQLYDVYKRRCAHFKDSMKKYNKCLQIDAFKDAIESIDNSNLSQPRLEELLHLPFIHLTQLVPLFNSLKDDFSDETDKTEKLEELCFIFTSLSLLSEQAEKENDVETQLSKIHGLKGISFNPKRKYLDRQQCTYNKTQGTMFLFNDIFIFTKPERNEYIFGSVINVSQMVSFRVKNKKTVVLEIKNETCDIGFKDTQTAEKCAKYLNNIKYEMDRKKIFGTEIKSSVIAREEESTLIPNVIHKIFDKLEKEAPDTEGIFRISVSVKDLEETMTKIDLDVNVDVSKMSCHLLGNVLKKYLNLMPNKLPISLQTVDVDNIKAIQDMLEPVGKSYLLLMERLFRLLKMIDKNSGVNKMTADNLAKVICPNIYEEDEDFGMNIEKLTRTAIVMIQRYDEIFGEFRSSFEKKIQDGMQEINHQKELEAKIQSEDGFKEIPVSKLVEGHQDDKTVVLTLKDIIKQGDVEMLEGKKWGKKWVVMKKNCLMIFRNMGEGQTLMVLPFKNMIVATETKMNRECIILRVDKQSVTLYFEDPNEWLQFLSSF
ncbi:rhogap domain containing protein [Entamoeba histolytica]|uniref:RhoGAP domain containing protein n=5 Tax=Entamoeba histolytica TaxID=5759 RepID=C4LV70_ENTH1|nr:RhoGAP domain containing protein [Entamoeba histolytica HM-1:IMSS]EAL49773.1 RhoGAP domain containing protein [Entamoeba histolytica HM-1:IMSS]EMD42879.1 T-cell activation Rho GTPase activating protein, putative [Entamoeba histolytica KU27]ENY62064.1 T-cell activation Rho GTPase activating protein, putative [Entamoeba histolytica HM-1:IMSS-A]GAT92555.1 rhogap domain containing protein [Entamoeba histolytica]|eukprot:XP_655159.1 RhoGAP domain containing protein [Entamoeba histolytica HM-1:IMSS]